MIFKKGLDASEALILRSVLEGAGISVWLSNEHMASMNYAVTADLLIREGDKWRADQVMQDVSTFPADAPKIELGDLQECHYCGSTDVFNFVGTVPIMGGILKSRAFPGSPWRRCLECRKFFRVDNRRYLGNAPTALLWGGILGCAVYGLNYAITWLRIML
ncbi:hypothetical protein QGN29_01975 [Temperatibacter marinus]|uniref:DUF2007 domain-containing protein n=1 Tax=Temperatibacter marinus TaxID=1456591 RepID=A0AA52EGA1_9PROT|nr:hypothetical protein [Temperatibacter marinus]WND03133.1 hypothetical protein QGN29_01975 [Temperatibacter marinus]